MTVSTADRKIATKRRDGGLRHAPVKAAILLPHGRAAFVDASTGMLTNTSNSGANKFAGVMALQADNSAGANGDINGEYFADGSFEMVGSGFAQADVGKKVYLADNGDGLTKTSTNASLVGSIDQFISSTVVMVEIDTQPA